MTADLQALKNLVKQFNERIAKVGRQYGNDSLIYNKVVENVKKVLSPTLRLFEKTTSSGFFAIDQKLSTLEAIQGVQTETALENAIHGFKSTDGRKRDIEGIPTLGEYNAKIRQGLQREEAFSDFDAEFEQTKEYEDATAEAIKKAKADAQMKQYSNVKEAVQKFLKDNPTAVSPIVNDMSERIMERRPTYWEWYRAIDRYINGKDSESWKNIQETTAQMMKPTKPQIPQTMQQMAEQEAENIRTQADVSGTDPYAIEKPTMPVRKPQLVRQPEPIRQSKPISYGIREDREIEINTYKNYMVRSQGEVWENVKDSQGRPHTVLPYSQGRGEDFEEFFVRGSELKYNPDIKRYTTKINTGEFDTVIKKGKEIKVPRKKTVFVDLI